MHRGEKMKKHNLRFLDNIKQQIKKEIDPTVENWLDDVFNDISENGKKITIVEVPLRSDRPAIGLCGNKYFCEAGEDFDREDTLVIFRVECAEKRKPGKIPTQYSGKFIPITLKDNPTEIFDSVKELFISNIEKKHDEIISKLEIYQRPVGKVSTELSEILSYARVHSQNGR